MAGVWADNGIEDAANEIRSNTPVSTAKVFLFTNNVTPTDATVLADLTKATFAGYADQSVAWPSGAVVAAHVATVTATTVSWTITAGSQTVYGWGVMNSAGTRLLWAQRDDGAPIAMNSSGINVYSLTLTFSTKDQAT